MENQISAKMILVTPEIAAGYLKTSKINRIIRQEAVIRYADDMNEDRWMLTGETISIDTDGCISNGHHRMLAVIKSGKSVNFLIATGVPTNAFKVIDTGCLRNASDIFKIEGVKNNASIPSIIQFSKSLDVVKSNSLNQRKNKKLTNAELLEEYNKRPLYWQKVFNQTTSWYIQFTMVVTKSMLGGLYCMFEKIDSNDAFLFMEALCTGITGEKSITDLRQKLIKDKISPRKMQKGIKVALIIKAWNIFRMSGSTMLRFDAVRERFPKAI